MSIEIQEYKEFITTIKSKIQSSQIKASIKVNEELLKLYWDIAFMITEKQKDSSWGDGLLNKLSTDLKREFPNMKGFSYRNLRAIKQWYIFWQQVVAKSNNEIGQQVVAKIFMIPWRHNIFIVSKSNSIEEALFYIDLTIQNNYSRAMLKNDTVVEYSLKDINKPMGVSEYELTHVLPKNLKSSLPTIEEIENELGMMDE